MNNTVTITSDDIIEAVCKMLEPCVRKNVLPQQDCNRWGIDVLTNKHDPSLLMFHFVTNDMLEVNIEFDLVRFEREGVKYLDFIMELLVTQSEKAREVRAEDTKITLNLSKTLEAQPSALKDTVVAHNETRH